jgi:hypothetical protein
VPRERQLIILHYAEFVVDGGLTARGIIMLGVVVRSHCQLSIGLNIHDLAWMISANTLFTISLANFSASRGATFR